MNNNWKQIKLKEIAFEARNSYEPNSKDHLPYIGLEHIQQQSLHLNGCGISSNTQSTKKMFKKGNILFGSLRPYFRKVARPKFDGVCSTDITVIENKENISIDYLFYLIANYKFIDYATNFSNGTRMPRANWKVISKSEWMIPVEFKDQQKIGKILSNYDELIENNNQRIQILEKMAQLIYDEWFVKFKFPGHEKTKFVDSELGKIPEGWEYKNILDIIILNFIRSNCKKFSGEKEYFATANIEGITIIKNGEIVTYDTKPSRAQKEPCLNSIWFARMKETFKVLVFNKINQNFMNRCILSSGMAGFECEEKYLSFFYYTINSKEFHRVKDLHCTGATQMALTNAGMKGINILIPDEEYIIKYSELVNPMIDKILFLQEENKNLMKTRDLLLPKLISGEINIENFESE